MAPVVPAPEAFDALDLRRILWASMKRNDDPTGQKTDVPVLRYAVILGIIVLIGVVAAVVVGRSSQNVRPTAIETSPSPGVSMGPTPRY